MLLRLLQTEQKRVGVCVCALNVEVFVVHVTETVRLPNANMKTKMRGELEGWRLGMCGCVSAVNENELYAYNTERHITSYLLLFRGYEKYDLMKIL